MTLDAFLILRGMGGTDDEDVAKMRHDKVLEFDDAMGSAEWLIKNLNDWIGTNPKPQRT